MDDFYDCIGSYDSSDDACKECGDRDFCDELTAKGGDVNLHIP